MKRMLLVLAVWLDPRGRSVTDALPMLIIYPANAAFVVGAALAVRHWTVIRRELADARRANTEVRARDRDQRLRPPLILATT